LDKQNVRDSIRKTCASALRLTARTRERHPVIDASGCHRCLVARLAGWLASWLAGWLFGKLAGWLADWLDGWQDKTRQDKTRQDKTRQDKTRIETPRDKM
jgi:hypothetical protein